MCLVDREDNATITVWQILLAAYSTSITFSLSGRAEILLQCSCLYLAQGKETLSLPLGVSSDWFKPIMAGPCLLFD